MNNFEGHQNCQVITRHPLNKSRKTTKTTLIILLLFSFIVCYNMTIAPNFSAISYLPDVCVTHPCAIWMPTNSSHYLISTWALSSSCTHWALIITKAQWALLSAAPRISSCYQQQHFWETVIFLQNASVSMFQRHKREPKTRSIWEVTLWFVRSSEDDIFFIW